MSTFDNAQLGGFHAALSRAHNQFKLRFGGNHEQRQPVHVVYGGAHLFRADTVQKLGALAQRALDVYAPEAETLAEVLGIPAALATSVHTKVASKLRLEAVEDFRIDFEDGYGHRSEEEENCHAQEAAQHYVRAFAENRLSPFSGIRIKPLSDELCLRALKTLDIFVSAVAAHTPAAAECLVVTLPKVVCTEQVSVLCQALGVLEQRWNLKQPLRIEVMVESAPGLFDGHGRSMLPELRVAAGGRLFGAHVGAYDYTASLDIVAAEQRLSHPACDALRTQMKWAFAGTEVFLSDGATTVLPAAPHRDASLTDNQREENRKTVHAAWAIAAADIRHSLSQGFYQGWDLHPAQLVSRYGTLYGFFLEHLESATTRLRNFLAEMGQATRSGHTFDDAATGQGLLNFFLRGVSCGALEESDVVSGGLSVAELKTRSFAAIVEARRGRVVPP